MPDVYAPERRVRDDWRFAAPTDRGLILRLDSSNELAVCDADDTDAIAFSNCHVGEAHSRGEVILKNTAGTVQLRSAAVFPARSVVYQASAGKVDDEGTVRVGIALDEATGADALVEVLPD